MRTPINTHNHGEIYRQYFKKQVGTGNRSVFHGMTTQRGFGLGNFLGSLTRMALPIVATILKPIVSQHGHKIMKHVVRSGERAITQIANKPKKTSSKIKKSIPLKRSLRHTDSKKPQKAVGVKRQKLGHSKLF